MELGNGPKQDWACWKILTPLLEDFVQFCLGTWMHMRGVYPSHMEGRGVMKQLRTNVFW